MTERETRPPKGLVVYSGKGTVLLLFFKSESFESQEKSVRKRN